MTLKRSLLLLTVVALPLIGLAAAQDSRPTADEAAIEEVIMHAYVNGLWLKDDPDIMREGFAPTFVFQRFWDGELSTTPLEEWIEKMAPDKVPDHDNIRGEVTVLDVAGVAAVARLDFWQDDRQTFTDYFGLYKTEDGWKIVTKQFHAYR